MPDHKLPVLHSEVERPAPRRWGRRDFITFVAGAAAATSVLGLRRLVGPDMAHIAMVIPATKNRHAWLNDVLENLLAYGSDAELAPLAAIHRTMAEARDVPQCKVSQGNGMYSMCVIRGSWVREVRFDLPAMPVNHSPDEAYRSFDMKGATRALAAAFARAVMPEGRLASEIPRLTLSPEELDALQRCANGEFIYMSRREINCLERVAPELLRVALRQASIRDNVFAVLAYMVRQRAFPPETPATLQKRLSPSTAAPVKLRNDGADCPACGMGSLFSQEQRDFASRYTRKKP